MPYFGEMVVQKINIPVIEDFQNELLKKNYSNSYTKIIQSMLNRLLNHAVRRMIIDKNPFDYVEFVRHENKKNSSKIRYWTYEEYKAFKTVINEVEISSKFKRKKAYLFCMKYIVVPGLIIILLSSILSTIGIISI